MHEREVGKGNKILQIILIVLCALELILAVWINMEVHNAREYQKQISLGNKYLEELDYENAELCYRKAIKIDERKVEPYLKIANASAEQGNYNKANEILLQGKESIPKSSDKKQEILNQQEEIISVVGNDQDNSNDDDSSGETDHDDDGDIGDDDAKNSGSGNGGEQDTQIIVSEAHKMAEEVTGYTYLGGKEYDLSYINNIHNTDVQMGVPQTEWVNEKGYISAKKYDFDKDGKDEILVIVLDIKEDTKTQIFVLHMLEQQSDKTWKDAAVMELVYDTEKTYISSLTDISDMQRIDFFIKEKEEEIPYIYIESYAAASYFVNGESWGIMQILYQSERFRIGEGGLSVSGSDIPAEITLDEKKSSIANNVYAKKFIDGFNALHMRAPAYLGFYTPLVYEDENLIYMAGCRKTGTVSTEKAVEWQKGKEEKLQALKVTLRDYTGEEGEKAGKAGAAFTGYIRENMPDSWYVIVDMDKIPVLLTAGNTGCEEKPWLEWTAFSDSAEVFLYDNGAVVSAGHIQAAKGAQLYYAVQKVTAVTEKEIKSYKLENKKIIGEKSIFPYNYACRLEFHKCGQDGISGGTMASDIRIGTYRRGDEPDSVSFKGSYSLDVLAVEGDKMHLTITYMGKNYSPIYDTEITDAVILRNTVTFDWTDSWANEGHGELIFHGDRVTANMQVIKSADFNRGSLAANALELTYVE